MPDPKIRCRAPIEINKINPYVRVRPEQAARLRPNWRRPMPVRIQVNGKPDIPWRINLMPVGDGSFFLYLHGQVRKEAGTSVGDVVSLTIEFDDDYKGGPVDPMPPWFGDELQRNPAAQSGGTVCREAGKKKFFRYLVRLKSSQAQQRNVQGALQVLAGGKARFMARSWNMANGE
jgi:hypothetical protein